MRPHVDGSRRFTMLASLQRPLSCVALVSWVFLAACGGEAEVDDGAQSSSTSSSTSSATGGAGGDTSGPGGSGGEGVGGAGGSAGGAVGGAGAGGAPSEACAAA